MNQILLTATLITGFASGIAYAQENKTPKNEKKLQFVNIAGFYSEGNETMRKASIENYRVLAPNSEILDDDFSGYTQYREGGQNVKTYSINCGLEFIDKEKSRLRKNSEIRFGINTSKRDVFNTSYQQYVYPSDPNNQNYYPDTTYFNYYGMKSSSKQFQFDLSYIYKFMPQKLFSCYVGLGIQPGLQYANRTDITNQFITHTFTLDPPPNSSSETSPEGVSYWYWASYSRQEDYSNKDCISLGANLPVGIELKLSKKDPFLNSIHLFLEARPGVNLVFKPETGAIGNSYVNLGGGLRFCRQ